MSKSILELKSLIKVGAGMSIDAENFSTLELKSLAKEAKISGVTLIFRNLKSKSTLELKSITKEVPKQIIFEF